MIIYILLICMILSFALLTYFAVNHNKKYRNVFKIITSMFFIAICIASYLTNHTNFTYFTLILIGLVFSLIGDILLEFNDNRKMFLLGVGSFALTHIFYSCAFIYLVPPVFEYSIVAFILASSAIYMFILIKGFDFKNNFNYISLYIFVIMFMVSKAFSLYPIISLCPIGIPLVITGAVLFMVSDLLLCFYMFYTKCPKWLGSISLFIYYVAQVMIALSVVYI